MNIVGRLNVIGGNLPGRIYVHNSGLELYSSGSIEKQIEAAFNHAMDVRSKIPTDLSSRLHSPDLHYMIAMAWGVDGKKMVDVIGLSDVDLNGGWPGNPTMQSMVYQDGFLRTSVPQDIQDFTCGDGVIILGVEEVYRRQSQFNKFKSKVPEIPGVELIVDRSVYNSLE